MDKVLELAKLATPGPYFFDSYSRVMSEEMVRKHKSWAKENMPDNIDDETVDWKRLAAEEPCTTVCRVPRQAGDTATKQGAIDAEYLSLLDPGTVSKLVVELQKLREVARLIDDIDVCEGYTIGDDDYPKFWAALEIAREVLGDDRR